ncbi:MAG: phosphomannomutase [Gemmatales bacterium]|nr:MAG: phosphomannomutase [Gemmatales bacterium]
MSYLEQAEAGIRSLPFDETIKDRALRYLADWLTLEEFAAYRPQLHWLIETKQWTGLLDRFCQILPFGTGGRRGQVGIGPNRMNLWTLGASVQGHCVYLRERFPSVSPLRVVLAYDVRRFEDRGRNYNPDLPNPVLHLSSRQFAEHAACVYAANGIHAYILPSDSQRFLATPELSFTIRFLSAHGGLNISASHNPPDDNGGKFYDERGGQPVPPDDQIMADLVDQVRVVKTMSWPDAMRSGRILFLDDQPHKAYIDLCRKQSLVAPPRFDEIRIVFTPLHGVGSMTAMEALIEQGFRVNPVDEQMTPDGQFPNVTKAPNPEVPESMDRALRVAKEVEADLILATDPDADRLGGMVPSCEAAGEWRFLTGNEIAALLTYFKLSQLAKQGQMPSSPIVVKTEVTTSLVTRIARHFKAQIVDDLLVGFKYIADVLWSLEQTGRYGDVSGTPDDFIIGVEESHGILVTPKIRDKDAAGAAVLLAELALDQKRQGSSVHRCLLDLYRQFGYVRNSVVPVVMAGLEGKRDMMRMLDGLRSAPPKVIGGLEVTAFDDLQDESGRLGPFKGETDRASRNVLSFRLGETGRITLRPSGTEPKAKAYVELASPPCPTGTSDEDWRRACDGIDKKAKQVTEDFLQLAFGMVGRTP